MNMLCLMGSEWFTGTCAAGLSIPAVGSVSVLHAASTTRACAKITVRTLALNIHPNVVP